MKPPVLVLSRELHQRPGRSSSHLFLVLLAKGLGTKQNLLYSKMLVFHSRFMYGERTRTLSIVSNATIGKAELRVVRELIEIVANAVRESVTTAFNALRNARCAINSARFCGLVVIWISAKGLCAVQNLV